jgi:hypothetical protein
VFGRQHNTSNSVPELTTACCNYGNDTLKVATYGRLYNWYAIGDYTGMGKSASFWSSEEINTIIAWSRGLGYYNSYIYRTGSLKYYGFSVRCVRD